MNGRALSSEGSRDLPNRYLAALRRHLEADEQAPFCRLIGLSGEVVLTRAEVRLGCGGYGEAYRAAGLQTGGVVLIFLKHVPDLYGSFFGAMLGGFVPSFMPCVSPRQDPSIYWQSHAELLERIQPAAIVAARDTIAEMEACGLSFGSAAIIRTEDVTPADLVVVERHDHEIALLQHSSGTTGLKKGVALSFQAIADQVDSYAAAIQASEHDRIVHWLPLYHDMGLIACAVMPAYLGIATVHIDPLAWVGRPDMLLEAIDKHRGTLTWMPNFAFEHIVNVCGGNAAAFDLSSMRAFINCSEPCKPRSFDRFAEAFAASGVTPDKLHCCYAMAETVFAVSQTALGLPPARLQVDPTSLDRGCRVRSLDGGLELLSTGMLVQGMNCAIVDGEGHDLGESVVGELSLESAFLFSGYNKEPKRTAERLSGGRYRTGDLGFTLDGQVYVLGRTDDLIIVNGRNIYAHQVEAAITAVDGLKPGRSVAAPQFDPKVGSDVLVVISERKRGSVRTDGEIRAEILKVVQSTFNVLPRKVRLVDEGWLIKTTSGKISRTKNVEKLASETRSERLDPR